MLSTDALVDLGETLRRHGFDVSAHELIAARHLLAGLSARPSPPVPRALAPYLAPVFCSTPDEQKAFFALYDTWADAWVLEPRPEAPLPPPPPVPPDPRLLPSWIPALFAFLLLVALLVAVWLRPLELAVSVEAANGQALAARVELQATGRSSEATAAAPATITYRRDLLPLTLRATAAGYEPDEKRLETVAPELRIVLKPAPPDEVPPLKAPEVPPGFTPAGTIPALVPEVRAPLVTEVPRYVPEHLAVLAGFLLLLAAGWVWNALRRRGWLERLPASGRETEQRLQADQGELRLAFHRDILHLGRELRWRRMMPTAELDVDGSLAATLRRGGLFSPVYGSRVEPEFLVLVDRASLKDHLALLADELVRGLFERRLSVERFFYDRSPARCRHKPLKRGAPDLGSQDLDQLFARFSERRLILFGDGRDLLDPYTGHAIPAVERLLQWGRLVVLVTPRPQPEWGRHEWALERLGFALLPLGRGGLKLLGEVIARDRVPPPSETRAADSQPPAYLRDLDRLLDGEHPGDDFVRRVVDALARDLPPAVFAWLAACGVYPEIHWGITLRVGACLIPDEQLLAARLPALAQLPWLRHGYMPDWLREALLARLSAQQQSQIRTDLDVFLSRLREAHSDEGALRITAGGGDRSVVADVLRGLKALFSAKAVLSGPAVEDRVFLRFMSQPPNLLGVRVSEALRRMLYRDGLPLAGMRPAPMLAAAMVGAGVLLSVLPPRETVPRTGPTPAPIVRMPTALALDADGRGLLLGDDRLGMHGWNETDKGWELAAVETTTDNGAMSAVALGAGRMLGVSAGGLEIRPAGIGGQADRTVASRLQSSPVAAAVRYGEAADGTFQLQALAVPGLASDELCVAIDTEKGEAVSVGARFLAGLLGGKHKPVACAVSQGAHQLAVLTRDGSIFVLPLRKAPPRTKDATQAVPVGSLPADIRERGLAVSADGATLASVYPNGQILVLRAGEAKPSVLDGLDAGGLVALSGDGLTLAYTRKSGEVQVLRLEKPGRRVLLAIATDVRFFAQKLLNPVPDVRRVADVFQRRYGFEVTRLENPTRAAVLKTLDDLRSGLVQKDRLVIYFSGDAWLMAGAGGKEKGAGKGGQYVGFAFPPEGRDASAEIRILAGDELAARVAAIPAREIMFIVDFPLSGALVGLPRATVGGGGARALLYSARSDQRGLDSEAFSNALANALASAPGPITGRGLAAELTRRLRPEARSAQTPGYADWLAAGHTGGEVLLSPLAAALPEIASKVARFPPEVQAPAPTPAPMPVPEATGGGSGGTSNSALQQAMPAPEAPKTPPGAISATANLKHGGQVTCVVFSPDGRRIISGGEDNSLRIWDSVTLVPIGEPLSGHSSAVTAVAISPDGRRIVSGSSDLSLRLWDAQSGLPMGEPVKLGSIVTEVAFSPDGRRIASGGWDGSLRLWDGASLRPQITMKGHSDAINGLDFSPDGRRLVTGSADRTLRLWDLSSGGLVGSTERFGGGISSVAFSPDGRRIVSGDFGNEVRLWDGATLAGPASPVMINVGGDVAAVSFSADGRYIIVASSDAALHLYDAATSLALGPSVSGLMGDPRTSVAFSRDVRRLVSGGTDGFLKVRQVPSPQGLPMSGKKAVMMGIPGPADDPGPNDSAQQAKP